MNHETRDGEEAETTRRVGGRRSREEREHLLHEYHASGETPTQFAARVAGLKAGTLRLWLWQQRQRAGSQPARFAPVRIVGGSPAAKEAGTITVRWPQGLEMEISHGADSVGARRLVRELVTPCLR